MRSLSPSTTLVWTRTESPTLNFASSLRNCSDSILSNIAWFINLLPIRGRRRSAIPNLPQQIRPPLGGAPARLRGAPLFDLRMMAREQNLRHFHAPEFRRSRVMRILESRPAGTERFVARALLVAQHTRQQPRHRFDHY